MAVFSTSTLIRHLGSAFKGRRIQSHGRRDAVKRRPESSPGMEPLEDRRLLSYTITNLGSLGGTVSVPVDLNNHGEVVGYSDTANNAAQHAFLYSHGRMTDLGTLGGTTSEAMGINDRGDVVGTSNVAPGNEQVDAFLDRGGVLTDLGTIDPAFEGDGLVSVNAGGLVSGLSAGDDAALDRQGKVIDLGALAGLGSVARGINDSGQVVGFSPTGSLPAANGSSLPSLIVHAFLYRHGKMSDLGTLGGMNSAANSINDHGAVVGSADPANDSLNHAFLYSKGRMTDLGTLGGPESVASAINNKGAVVGYSLTSTSTSATHGFIDQHGRMVDLNSLIPTDSGFVIAAASGINDRGQILAQGYETSSPNADLALLLNPSRSAR